MWKVEFYDLDSAIPCYEWPVYCDTFVEVKAVAKGRLETLFGTPQVLLGAIRDGLHTVYLRGKEVGKLKFMQGK